MNRKSCTEFIFPNGQLCSFKIYDVVISYDKEETKTVCDELAEDYRFGYKGQVEDDEIKGEGNSVNFEFRMHDQRLGRFLSLDPLSKKYPHNSPYAFSENKVIHCLELEGLEAVFAANGAFLEWGKDKSSSAQVKVKTAEGLLITLSTNDKGKTRDITVKEFLNRAHWAYGEGSGVAAEYYAHAINNKAAEFGENKIYKYMISSGESGTSQQRQEANFSGNHENDGEVSSSDPYNVFANTVNTVNNRNENLQGINSNPMIQHLVKEMIEVLQGEVDPTNGARHWAEGEGSINYAKKNSQEGSTITIIRTVSMNKVKATHIFYLLYHPKGGYSNLIEKYVTPADQPTKKPVKK